MKNLMNALLVGVVLLPASVANHRAVQVIGQANTQMETMLLTNVNEAVRNSAAKGLFSVNVSYDGIAYALAYDTASKVKEAGYSVTLDRASHSLSVSW